MTTLRHLLAFVLLLPLIASCASGSSATDRNGKETYQADLSCSYFYYLWGTHAEYDQRFDEALEAYEKALICDPTATHVEKKLPVLLFRLGETEKAAELLRIAIQKDPEDISQYLLLAHLSIQQDKRNEAILLYKQVIRRDPSNEGVLLRLGILAVQQGELDEAEQTFHSLIKANPEMYFGHIYIARLYHMMGETGKAAKAYENALTLNWSPELVFEMVEFYQSSEKYEEMLRLYETILKNDSENERAILGKIQTLLTIGKDEEALTDLRKLRDINTNTARLDMAIAKILLRLGKVSEAAEVLEGIRSGETASEANYLLGLIAFQSKLGETSLGYLQAIDPSAEEYVDGVYLQIRIMRVLGLHDQAIELLKKATDNPKSQTPVFYALLSSIYLEQERVDDAMASIVAGTIAFPKNEQLHFEHALLLERAGLHKKALSAMLRVLEISPDHPEALNFVGYSWADQNINLKQAYKYIVKAVKLKPDNGFIRDSLGWVYYRLGNFDNALEALLHALKLEPKDPHIYVHLGDVYRALNRVDDAREAYLRGLEMFDDENEKGSLEKKLNDLSTQ